jgi:hypothetical protein
MADSGRVSGEDATPHFEELTGHINDAATQLQSVSPSARLKARNNPDLIAGKCATIIISIATACKGFTLLGLLDGGKICYNREM